MPAPAPGPLDTAAAKVHIDRAPGPDDPPPPPDVPVIDDTSGML
jgi:hypothetical protein